MSYIGRGIDQIDNISTLDNLSFNGSSTTFNLTQNSVAFVPVSADALQIQIDGVIQSGNYTCSGSTVTFDFTPSGSSVCNGIRHFGSGVLTAPSDGSVTSTKLGNDSVINSKIQNDAVTVDKLNLISTGSVPSLEAKGTSGVTEGYIQLNCAENSHGIKLKSPPHSAGASYTLTFPNNDGDANQFLQTNGSGVLSFANAGGTHEKLLSGSVSSATNHDFNNFVDTSKYNYYLVQISNALGMGTYSPFSLQARTSGGAHTGSNYSFASYGYRSSGNTTLNYGENQGRTLLGTGITGVANKPAGLMFYMVVNPSANAGGTHGWGINWGWNTTNSDIQWENFSYMVEYTGTTTGFRLYADSNNATTFDYAIYGIAK